MARIERVNHMPFEKGQSGNPAGRPPGARGKATLLAEEMIECEASAIIRAVMERAKEGDIAAARLCLDRVAPRPRHRAVAFEMPTLNSAADGASAVAGIIAAVANGDMAPAEAGEMIKLVDAFLTTLAVTTFEERLARLEGKRGLAAPKREPESNAEGSFQAPHAGTQAEP
jgi:hypothetical protein